MTIDGRHAFQAVIRGCTDLIGNRRRGRVLDCTSFSPVGDAAIFPPPFNADCLETCRAFSRGCLRAKAPRYGARAGFAGTPQLESVRAEVVARAKAEPVLFLEPPKDTTASPEVSVLRERLYHKTLPWKTFGEVYLRYRRHPRELRQVLLTDGYLYAEQPAVAALLANSVVLNQLFTERAIVITRGSQTLHAKRKSGDYYWTDGPERGMPATLWLFDRVAVEGENLGPSKLVALGDIRSKTGADAIEIERLTQGAILAQLVYGD